MGEKELNQEQEQKKQTITRSYRVDDTTADKIAGLAKELGLNQNGVFEVLLSAYELQQDKVLAPDSAKDIDTFISHLQSIQDAYHHLIDINLQTEERVRQEYAIRLENNDRQIADLLNTKTQMKEALDRKDIEIQDLNEAMNVLENAANSSDKALTECRKSLEDKQLLIETLTARLPEQAEIDAKISGMEKELNELRSALSAAETASAEAIAKADKAESDLVLAQTEADLAQKQAEKDRTAAEKAHAKELQTAVKEAAAELKMAVAEARQEERDKAAEKEEKLQAKIEELRAKVDAQKDQIAELKSKK